MYSRKWSIFVKCVKLSAPTDKLVKPGGAQCLHSGNTLNLFYDNIEYQEAKSENVTSWNENAVISRHL